MIHDLLRCYEERRAEIEARLAEFHRIGQEGDDEAWFLELAYCLLTPQARGRNAWQTVERLRATGLLWKGTVADLEPEMHLVRFRRKARYLVAAREQFQDVRGRIRIRERLLPLLQDPADARRWLVRRIPGMGYKEASHFLRNIGFGDTLAILDRHILRYLVQYGVIPALPRSLTPRRYEAIEHEMRAFAARLGLPLAHLDLLLWSLATGEVFK